MIAKATLRYVRISPRKFRLVIPLIKGKNPEDAIALLMSVKKKASTYAIDLLRAAIANAKRSHEGIDPATLYISNMIANCGPTLKRFRAGSMGRASGIRKRTSHLTVELDAAKAAAAAVATPATESAMKKAAPRTPAAAKPRATRAPRKKE